MSSARFQNIRSIYKNLHTDNLQPKNKIDNDTKFIIYNNTKKNKICRNNFNQRATRLVH